MRVIVDILSYYLDVGMDSGDVLDKVLLCDTLVFCALRAAFFSEQVVRNAVPLFITDCTLAQNVRLRIYICAQYDDVWIDCRQLGDEFFMAFLFRHCSIPLCSGRRGSGDSDERLSPDCVAHV